MSCAVGMPEESPVPLFLELPGAAYCAFPSSSPMAAWASRPRWSRSEAVRARLTSVSFTAGEKQDGLHIGLASRFSI